jgi:pyruvate,water dikinase
MQYGGKSTSLGELIASGINVPPGFAVSTAAFDAFMMVDGLAERVSRSLTSLDPADVGAVTDASTEIALEMRRTPVPEALRAAVTRDYGTLASTSGCSEPAVAVRSSARGEDSADATFAGQQETYLWVVGVDGVCEAIRDCWISLYSPPAISYRSRMTADADAAMGVTVQLMVDAEVSGVMFTCSPLSGDPSVITLNASWGLGLAVVGGEVTPDEFVLSKVTSEVLRATLGDKTVEYVPDPSGSGTSLIEVAADRRTQPSLTDEQLPALVALGRRVENHFGTRQDIEWAIGRNGSFPDNLYVLQSRPVTVSGPPTPPTGDIEKGDVMALLLGTFGVDSRTK